MIQATRGIGFPNYNRQPIVFGNRGPVRLTPTDQTSPRARVNAPNPAYDVTTLSSPQAQMVISGTEQGHDRDPFVAALAVSQTPPTFLLPELKSPSSYRVAGDSAVSSEDALNLITRA